jgi:transposase InsO family protein
LKPPTTKETPVKLHGNAKLTPVQRRLLVVGVLEEHWTFTEAADALGVSERTAYRWVRRWKSGDHELADRSSAPKHVPSRTPAKVEQLIEQLRRTRMTAPKIAAKLRMAVSTVCAVLTRIGLNRLSKLGPPEPPNRYVRRRPGELIHVDIKQLGRFVRPGHRVRGRTAKGVFARRGHGWDYVHVAVDDYSRVAYVEVLDTQTADDAVAFLDRAIAWFADLGVRVRSVMSDNGSCYVSRDWAHACRRHRIKHLRTRPNRPRTNGKAERFIQTLQREWAYAAVYQTSSHRNRALHPWLRFYNRKRPHGSLGHQPPASRLPAAN